MAKIVVCGAHLKEQPLNWRLTERGEQLHQKTTTSHQYRLYDLPEEERPALVRDESGDGQANQVEIWQLPNEYFGSLVAAIPSTEAGLTGSNPNIKPTRQIYLARRHSFSFLPQRALH
ncbi:allophanate hydrolase-related protein [Microbulbifer sp. CNSA002]|uniref:allophanate hydrolase-related protein n=1 Tax=unclassified Microbulbifer TaxID=2619833 RepID=UPI0039B6402D